MANKKKKSASNRSGKRKKVIRSSLSHDQRIWVKSAMSAANQALSNNELNQAGGLLDQILQVDPFNVEALEQLALIFSKLGESAKAVSLLERAIDIDSRRTRSMYMLACLIGDSERELEAIELYKKVIQTSPDLIEAHNNLGVIYKNTEQFELAIDRFRRVVKADPKSGFALSNLGNVLKDAGKMNKAVEMLARAVAAEPTLTSAYSNLLVSLNYLSEMDASSTFQRHLDWYKHLPSQIRPDRFSFSRSPSEKKKLRIGYVSPDLHNHSVGYFVDSIFSHYDRDAYEVVAYYNNLRKDPIQSRFSELVDEWVWVEGLGDVALADRIYSDQIDILVDLAGHTANNRLAVFYQKPAPIQVTWLGYPNTTGLKQIDYRLSDAIADPVGISDEFHSEKVWRLDKGFLCYTPLNLDASISELPALGDGGITFGSFNNLVKVSDEVVSAWAEILTKVPAARLLIKSRQLGNAMTRERLIKRFEQCGINAERLSLHAMLASREEHMSLYGQVDIALDTFPYNGTTTTCEAMWMGVPTLTLNGDRHASRVGASIMSRVGREDLVADSISDYIARAVSLSDDLNRLAEMRVNMRSVMKASSLCQPSAFCQTLEGAYRSMWSEYLS